MVNPGFQLRKLYADLVTPEGHVIVAYLGWLTVAGLRTAYAAVETYAPDGTRQVTRGRPSVDMEPIRSDGVEYRILAHDGRTFRLSHRDPLPPWYPDASPVGAQVRWHVTVPRANATATWDGGAAPTLSGDGYSDYVRLARPPRLLGLRRLQWGRVHLPGHTVVFNTVDRADGTRWTRLVEWSADGPPVQRSVDGAPGADDWTVPTRSGPIALVPIRELHKGQPLDLERFPYRLERWASRAANGPAHEVRWLSQAIAADGAAGMALHESVWFGRALGRQGLAGLVD